MWIKGHNNILGNEESDRLAKDSANQDVPTQIDLRIPIEFDLQGAKLATISQSIAYKGILAKRTTQQRQDSLENIAAAKDAIEEVNQTRETDAAIWESMKRPSLDHTYNNSCTKQPTKPT